MAREPVTRLQLDAYRFGQRRLESALARRDPVLMHEEIRGQRRVVLTGLALAILVLLGSFGYARVASKPAWERQTIIAAKQSGRMYVVIHRPHRLVPVRNMVAARLVLAAAAGPGRAPAAGAVAVIDDAVLDRAPRTAAAAVPGADGVRLPDGASPDPLGDWAVCDVADGGPRTVAVAGAAPAAPMPADQGLLLQSLVGDLYLVTGGRRHKLDDVEDLQRAYDLVDVRPRKVSAALLQAIPEAAALRMPDIPDSGEAAPGGLPARVGDIVRVAGAGGERFYLVLAGGVQEVARPVANLIRTGPGVDRSRPPVLVGAEQVNVPGRAKLPGLEDFPTGMPRVPSGPDAQSVCWRWYANGGGALTLGRDAPIPPDQQRTQLAQADGAGPKLDVVSVPTGRPLVLRTSTGGVWLVSDTGVGYRVAGGGGAVGGAGAAVGAAGGPGLAAGAGAANETANALGIRPDAGDPAPEQALRLLPAGPDLDLQSVTRTVDVLVGPGPG